MAASNTKLGAPLQGLDQLLASLPRSGSLTGGTDQSTGVHTSPNMGRGAGQGPATGLGATPAPAGEAGAPGQQPGPQQELGPFFEDDEATNFDAVHQLVLRQERLARNRLAQDRYYTMMKLGYAFARLEKIQNQDIYKLTYPPGMQGGPTHPSAVPNKAWDLVNKVTETLMVDPPRPALSALNQDESAERAVEMAREFLTQDGQEGGTNDSELFWSSIEAALARSASFHHYWVDPEGGGSIPLQIKAHPQATDVQNPLVAADPQTGQPIPTADYILRYVTPDQQFTDDPSQADRTWVPKICVDQGGREHFRFFPEHLDIARSTTAIGLLYCTLGEAKRRWPAVAELTPAEQGELSDWQPPRYIDLLPPALRGRWKIQTGSAIDKPGTSNDERLLFYYVCYKRSSSEYPKGCKLYTSGAFGGFELAKDTLTADIPRPDGKGTDVRDMDIPIVGIRLIQDADDKDPTGRTYLERFAGANEATATLITSYQEMMDLILHPATYTVATSPIEGWQVEESRATGDHIPLLKAEDQPQWSVSPQLPPNFLQVVEFVYQQMDSIGASNAPAQGADRQQEVSGVARQIAVQQSNVSASRFQQALHTSYSRHWRIKIQLAMKHFSVPQQMRYAGEDGAYKQDWWTGTDFAQIADNVTVQPGTGTMMAPQARVQYVSSMRQLKFLSDDEAEDVARATFSETLGVPDDPQQQRIERQVGQWLKGAPDGWLEQAAQYDQAVQQIQQQAQAAQQQYQMLAAQAAQAMQPPPPAPPPPQMPPAPWSPFATTVCDDEPLIAGLRLRRLRKLLGTVRYAGMDPRWRKEADDEYTRMRQAVAVAGQAAANAGPQAKLSADLEKIRLAAGLKQNAAGAPQAEAETITRDEGFVPDGGKPPQTAGH